MIRVRLQFVVRALLLAALCFDSSLVFCDELLDFDSAVRAIVSRGTDVQVQESTLNSIEARNMPARLFFLPSLSVDGRQPIWSTGPFIFQQQQLQITSQWNLFRWGADYMGLRAAQYEESSQHAQVDAAILKTEGNAIQVIVLEIQRKKEVEINTSIVSYQVELSQIAEERYKRGYLPEQEAEKVTIDLSNAKASLIDSKMNENEARANLENLLGHSRIHTEWPWLEKMKAFRVSDAELNFSQRPDWIAAQSMVQSLDYRTSQNWRFLLPSLDAQVSYGYFSSSFFGSGAGWVGALTVSLPLFDRLTGISKAKEQASLRTASEAQLEQVQRTAKAEWSTARNNFELALESAQAREKNLSLSRKLYDDNLKRFQAGRISSNDLVIDRTRMYQAELNAVQGWSAAHLNFARLCHSLGYRVEKCVEASR